MKQSEGVVGGGQEAVANRAGEAIVTPLRKRRLSGELYERDPKTEALIAKLAVLPRDALIARAEVTKRSDPNHIPSECLIYFIRASRRDNNELWFERLYRILTERVLRSLPKAESPDGETEYWRGRSFLVCLRSAVQAIVRRFSVDLSMIHSIVVDRFGSDVQKRIVIFCWKIRDKIF